MRWNKKLIGGLLGAAFLTVSLGVGAYLVQTIQKTKIRAGGEAPLSIQLDKVNTLDVMGDSISAGGYTLLRQKLNTRLGVDLNYSILSVAASRTEHLMAQWESALPHLRTNNGDTIFVATIGGNDAHFGIPLSTAIANIESVLLSYKNKKTSNEIPGNVHFFIANVYNPFDGRDPTPECEGQFEQSGAEIENRVRTWRTAYTALSDKYPELLTIVDAYTAFKGHGHGSSTPWFRDCVHPNGLGYRTLNNLFFDTIITRANSAPPPAPSSNPTPTPGSNPTPASGSTPVISYAKVFTVFSPWAVLIRGSGIVSDMTVRLYDSDGSRWGGNYTTTRLNNLIGFQLPDNSPPSKCNDKNRTCQIGIEVVSPQGRVSNRFNVTLPGLNTYLPEKER